MQVGKNFVSDGHFCKSFCPASHKISISGDFRHCCRVMIYLDCVMSKNHDLLQNKSLRNRLIKAASVMEFISTFSDFPLFQQIAHLCNILCNILCHICVIFRWPWQTIFRSWDIGSIVFKHQTLTLTINESINRKNKQTNKQTSNLVTPPGGQIFN